MVAAPQCMNMELLRRSSTEQFGCARRKNVKEELLRRSYLDEGSQHVGDVALVRLDVLLQEGVEVEQHQLVHANGARHDAHHEQPRLEALVAAVQPRKQALCEGLQKTGKTAVSEPAPPEKSQMRKHLL